jgi:Uma2 family endonuclease
MNAFAKIDPETFLRYAAEHPELRLELVKGRIVQQMTGGTKRHQSIARRIANVLENQLDRAAWDVVLERGVRDGGSIRYPDVCVEPASEPDDSVATDVPVVLVEVLSSSTTQVDLADKRDEYLKIQTLQAYIVASQDEPAMVIWQRQTDGSFPNEPRELQGIETRLDFTACGQTLALDFAQIYADLS